MHSNVWSASDNLTDVWPTYWDQTIKAFVGMIRVDQTALRFMGPADEDGNVPLPNPMQQIGYPQVYPTTTIYTFQGLGVQLKLCFTTPLIFEEFLGQQPLNGDKFELLSRPTTYLTYQVSSIDGKPHQVALYYDNTAEISVNSVSENVVWQRFAQGPLTVMRIGTQQQSVLGMAGDNVGINWGYAYVAVEQQPGVSTVMYGSQAARASFAQTGALPKNDDTDFPRPCDQNWPVLAVAWNFTVSPSTSVTKLLMFAYDDINSINFFGAQFPPYWRRNPQTTARKRRRSWHRKLNKLGIGSWRRLQRGN